MLKVVVVGLVGAFVIFYIMTSPVQAANLVHVTWHLAVNVAHGVGTFFNKVSA